jgi:Holliday junction resolvase-like predicted endonuclease
MKESEIQSQIIRWLECEGWIVVKLIQTNKNGWPDLQAHNYGFTIFIEVKSESGKLSELQKYRHEQLREKGFFVIVTTSLNQLLHEFISISESLQKKKLISNLN